MTTPSFTFCRIEMLGGLRIRWNNDVITRVSAQKVGTLLARLACYPSRAHAREELIELLWPEVDPLIGRNRLKQTLAVLRTIIEPEGIPSGNILLANRETVWLNAELVTTDVVEFETARTCAAGATDASERLLCLSQALEGYRGQLLPGFFEDWILTKREHLNRNFVEILLQLATAFEHSGNLNQSMEYGRRALDADALCEEAHCALMRFHALQGHPAEAIRQYREMERVLADELGEAPSVLALTLLTSIQEGRIEPVVPLEGLTTKHVPPLGAPAFLEPVGGAVPLSSSYYIARSTDREFSEALTRRDSIVLVKGPRQIGKTSLLARGLQQARDAGSRVLFTDLQRLTTEQMASAESLFRSLADAIIEQAELDLSIKNIWDPDRGWNVNFERFLRREVLGNTTAPLVWGMDEVDKLFPCAFGSEVFALFRSWHNLRSLHPEGPWSRLTLAMAYATEAHLFISDLNQSPFNVGTRLTLQDFTLEQVAELNRKYGSPLKGTLELSRFFTLLGGSPYLVRRGLHEMVTRSLDMTAFDSAAQQEDSPFRDHLSRMGQFIFQEAALNRAVREILQSEECTDLESFYRLRSAGVVSGDSKSPRLRCHLYVAYLQSHL